MSKEDRIFKTSIGAYDQVIALSQVMINEGLKNLWSKSVFAEDLALARSRQTILEKGEELPELEKPLGFSCSPTPNSFLDEVVFGPPQLILKPTGSDLSSIEYKFHLASGELQAICDENAESSAPEPVKRKPGTRAPIKKASRLYSRYTIKDWYVTIPIKLSLVPMEPTSKEFAEAMKLKKKGNHSLQKLLVDTSTINWATATVDLGYWAETDEMVDEDGFARTIEHKVVGNHRLWEQETPTFQFYFRQMIEQGFKDTWEKGLGRLCTIVKDKEDDSLTPTFEINDVRHQTYPYREGNTDVLHGIPQGNNHYLLYLETVGSNIPPPVTQEGATLSPSGGNWTEGGDYHSTNNKSKFGTYVLSKKCFLEGHLLPKLTEFNRIMQLDIMERQAESDAQFFHWYAKVGYKVHLGKGFEDRVGNSAKFDWTPGNPVIKPYWDDQHWYNKFRDQEEGQLIWSNVDEEWDTSGAYHHNGSVETWAYGSTITINRVVVTPGSNVIRMHGMSWNRFTYKVDPSKIEWNRIGGFLNVVHWEINFVLQASRDGGLFIEVKSELPRVEFPWQANGKWGLEPFRQKLQTSYETVQKNFEYITEGLKNCLQGQDRLILPSTGVYLFSNPLMGHNGDLVCNLEYVEEPFDADGEVKKDLNEMTNFKRTPTRDLARHPVFEIAGNVQASEADHKEEI
ncbi:hypothetical protein PEX1_052830 [Penicillium expansum]|uniref:Uncharacterized protein n=1 Tax=Penicillium expansum TaxID=27334 RepID=A0A0A2KH51_PENEN|nr:hypothetical protein PEX2_004350 [Penicillium expansum]KGO57081.1 hypothetical protein PEX2_004350 [Penicillium expansum]KGO66278.1 hypothetical protein PEX1_052830 [Penicillium expansum]